MCVAPSKVKLGSSKRVGMHEDEDENVAAGTVDEEDDEITEGTLRVLCHSRIV
jgi:hypothetical protein